MGKYYPIQTIDGTTYPGPPGLEMLLAMEAPPYGTEIDIPVYDGSTGHFVYCYTTLTSILVGSAVQLNYTGSVLTTGYANPCVTVPNTAASVPIQVGIATRTRATAGGLWVQTKGRCFFARLDGATDVNIGEHLIPVDTKHYLAVLAAAPTVPTVVTCAIYEACRHGSLGATAWTQTAVDGTATYPFPSLVDQPIYFYKETLAYGNQGNATWGDPSAVIYLTGMPSTL